MDSYGKGLFPGFITERKHNDDIFLNMIMSWEITNNI